LGHERVPACRRSLPQLPDDAVTLSPRLSDRMVQIYPSKIFIELKD
jgi:hypothetical protein